MRRYFLIGMAAFFLCGASRTSPIHTIRSGDAEKLLAEGGILLLDVRTAEEYGQGHIPTATLVPIKEFNQRLKDLPADKTQPVLVYCTVGDRSSRAAKILARNGYKDIYNLSGGIRAWIADQKPIQVK